MNSAAGSCSSKSLGSSSSLHSDAKMKPYTGLPKDQQKTYISFHIIPFSF